MGTYLELKAKPGCEDQINQAYAAHRGDAKHWLVYSDKIIEEEIRYIHSPKGAAQAHLRPYLKTLKDWQRVFPALKSGTGQLKLSGLEFSEEESEEKRRLIADIAFILNHRMLFSSIEGLDGARELGLTDFSAERIVEHKGLSRKTEALSFAQLPKSRSALYRRCVEWDRADLWGAYLDFRQSPCEQTWCALRSKVISWIKGEPTIWQRVETAASERDGKHFGLLGRFRDGNIPSFWLLRSVLT